MQNHVKLKPPCIDKGTIAEKVVGTRPMREGRFKIGVEERGSKTVVHCYGHGGSGSTTLFGSVDRAIALYEEKKRDKRAPIRVIGSGMMGLTSAVELKRKGYHVAGVYTKERYNIPSWLSGGYFALVSIKNSPEEEANCHQIGIHTLITYRQIQSNRHPYLKDIVRTMPLYCSKETESGIESLADQGLIPPPREVLLDFGNGVRHPDFLEYQAYFVNTTELMIQLIQEVERAGIPIETRDIHAFDEIEESVIFNCSGIGAKELCSDSKMIPVRGHLMTLNEKSGTDHMNYMIYTKVKQEGRDEYVYMFPKTLSVTANNREGLKCHALLGGTFIPHADELTREQQEILDREKFSRLLDRASLFFTGKTPG